MAQIIGSNRRNSLTTPRNGSRKQLKIQNEKSLTSFVTISHGTWPRMEKQPNSPTTDEVRVQRKKGLTTRATMPLFGPPKAQKSITGPEPLTQTECTTPTSSSSSNADSPTGFFSFFSQLLTHTSPRSALAQTMMDLPNGGLPPLFCPAIVFGLPVQSRTEYLFESTSLGQAQDSSAVDAPWSPDIQVKSNHKENGRFIWKEMRAVLDTACTWHNWVTLDVVADLGVPKLLPLTPDEKTPAQTAGGVELVALGAVNLTWHGLPGGQIGNSIRNFHLRFLVLGLEDSPFEILIGRDSLWKCRILEKPVLAINPTTPHDTTVLPRAPDGKKVVDKKGHDERKEKARRRLKLQEEAMKLSEEAEKDENTVGDIDEGFNDHKIIRRGSRIPSMDLPNPSGLRSPRSWKIRKNTKSDG